MNLIESIAIVLLVIFIVIAGYLVWSEINPETREYEFNAPSSFIEKNISGNLQFYPNLRFKHSDISYNIETACNADKRRAIIEAFSIISERSMLTFFPSRQNPEIKILCSEIAPMPEQENHFVAGEGGPTDIVNASDFYIILESKVSLYREDKCSSPKIALHEILHALGFDHSSDKKNIMYPVTSCEQELDQNLSKSIDKLYEIPSLPDLAIESIGAKKTGSYLTFQVNVTNHGIVDSESASLDVYSDNKLVKSYELDNIPIGSKKIISVENLRISGDKVVFIANSLNPPEEISETDNRAEIELNTEG